MNNRIINVMEEVIVPLVNILVSGDQYQNFCKCQYCKDEILAQALNQLPPCYVSTAKDRALMFEKLNTSENIRKMNKEIIAAMYAVSKECKYQS